jgi:YfiR/HmsC-like
MVKKYLLTCKVYMASLMVGCVFFGSVFNVSAGSRESKILAGFLYNFSKYVQWPAGTFADDKSPFILCIVDQDSFVLIVEETLNGKKVEGRRVIIQSRKPTDDLNSCNLLYIGTREQEGVGEVVKSITGKGVLTVGWLDKTSNSKVVINLIKYKNKFKYLVNTDKADQENLQISSRLLQLAVKERK